MSAKEKQAVPKQDVLAIEKVESGFPEDVPVNEIIEAEVVSIVPMDVDAMAETYQKMTQFIKKVMRLDVDYGVVPGTKKPSLYKPGAEKLQRFFSFSAPQKLAHSAEQWEIQVTEKGFPLFHYRYTTTVYGPNGQLITTSDGECNSYESKYRWRWVSKDKVPSGFDISLLETQIGTEKEPGFAVTKKETTGQYGKSKEYWQTWEEDIASGKAKKITMKKRDQTDMDAWERDATVYRVPNDDIFSQVNTIMKMAQKRSYVGAIIIAANASEYFTQDLEDTQKQSHEEAPSIKTLVPDKNAMARKLMDYATSLGVKDAGNWIKKLLDDSGLVYSLDNWEHIISLVDQNATK